MLESPDWSCPLLCLCVFVHVCQVGGRLRKRENYENFDNGTLEADAHMLGGASRTGPTWASGGRGGLEGEGLV